MSTKVLRQTQQRASRHVKMPEHTINVQLNNNQQQKKTTNKKKVQGVQHPKTDTLSSVDDSSSIEDNESTVKKRKHGEEGDDGDSNQFKTYSIVPSIGQNFTSNSMRTTSVSSHQNLPSAPLQTSSSITVMPTDTSTKTLSQNSVNKNGSINKHNCQYRVPSASMLHCRNHGTYQCSHCDVFFCLEHGIRHQEELKSEIRGLLTKTQELFDNVQKLNFIDVKTSCVAELNQWISTVHAKVDQIRIELEMTLVHFEDKLHERSDQLKSYLRNELENKVGCILTEQLQEFEVSKAQVEKAGMEFVRLENIFNSFNNRQLITMISNSDNPVVLNPPTFVCSDILINEFHMPEDNQETTDVSEPVTQETEAFDNSNVVVVNSLKMDTNIIDNTNTEQPIDMNAAHSMLRARPDLLEELFGDDSFESLIDNVLIEEVVSNINITQEPPRLKTPEPVAPLSQPNDSNFSLEQLSSEKKGSAELDLSGQELTDQDVEVVIQYALQNNKLTQPFETLDISSNKIGSKGMNTLCDALEKNSTLLKLNLHANCIQNRGAQRLGCLLQKNSTLVELDISQNQIGHEGMALLTHALKDNQRLTVLNLENNIVGHQGTHLLCLALEHNKTIQSLNLNFCSIEQIGVHYLAKLMKTNTSIKVLEIGGNQLGETGMLCFVQVLQHNTTLLKLNLKLNRIRETGAFYIGDGLRKNKTLREINLSQNLLLDAGIKNICDALQHNKVLTTLNISENGLRKVGAQHVSRLLSTNKTITDLDFSLNDIQTEGIVHMRDVLRINKTLTNLNLQKNRIGQQGIKALIAALKENKTLLTLDLKGNNLTASDEALLNERLTENRKKANR